ncbi:hypothetical protein F383_33582 [Gossypium arboreum]|uniref:Uncharacterized protein n=1 Tax=Gossypium arboreum TaxID=29729 RepID=A0A0B0MBX1_GOSAR|nr:hypothetical protein F383_38017 [Gossypium arboreum]KHF99662.1 hypothetical protein F383_38552 [Gossypium arboreum]KHG07138.1 hypothetical protein F383_33582 [Gossypium arboreum]
MLLLPCSLSIFLC